MKTGIFPWVLSRKVDKPGFLTHKCGFKDFNHGEREEHEEEISPLHGLHALHGKNLVCFHVKSVLVCADLRPYA